MSFCATGVFVSFVNFAMMRDLQVGGVNAHVGGVTFMLQNDLIGAVKKRHVFFIFLITCTLCDKEN